jgi:ribosome maturation factor RimP
MAGNGEAALKAAGNGSGMVEDDFAPFIGEQTKIRTQNFDRPLFGRLVSVSDTFLTVERRDKRRVLIRRDRLLTIEVV